jgi:hypothetical protein
MVKYLNYGKLHREHRTRRQWRIFFNGLASLCERVLLVKGKHY